VDGQRTGSFVGQLFDFFPNLGTTVICTSEISSMVSLKEPWL
jgi:hypothetical protein